MRIRLIIATDNLGAVNTAADNQRYCSAVQNELRAEYPDANISVELAPGVGFCWISDDPTGEIEENVNLIANKVWGEANY